MVVSVVGGGLRSTATITVVGVGKVKVKGWEWRGVAPVGQLAGSIAAEEYHALRSNMLAVD